MKYSDVVNREKEWHNERFKDSGDSRTKNFVLKYAYASTVFAAQRFRFLERRAAGEILDIGCGRGVSRAQFFASQGCSYTGVDISDECVKANNRDVAELKLGALFICDDANTLQALDGKTYDLIVMSGTLHHLDVRNSLKVFSALLKPKGRLLMWEPMGENPFMNLFRALTPGLRTSDERPLTFADLVYIKKVFPNAHIELHTFFSLLAMPVIFISDLICPSKAFGEKIATWLGRIDMMLGKIALVNRLHWIVIIEAKH